MKRRSHSLIILFALALPGLAMAQIGLGGQVQDRVGGIIGGVGEMLPLDQLALDQLALDRLEQISPVRAAQALLSARAERLTAFVRNNRAAVAMDDRGNPAVRDVVLVSGASDAMTEAIRQAGYAVEADAIEGLDIGFARVRLPPDMRLAEAMKRIRKLAPGAEISADTIHFPGGTASIMTGAALAGSGVATGAPIGIIDGGVAAHPSLNGPVEQRGFASGGPGPSGHGTAIASLIAGSGPITGVVPGAPLLVADVYGRDPRGGGALAIARALGWMAAKRVQVVTVSLVGPQNPLLASAIRQAQTRGMIVVAAVGNDGPAAPPAYPASYPGVIAVTGVDGRDRALIEAGRAAHLDYAAPGADMGAADADGGKIRVRGTSFAAPLVAGRLYLLRRGGPADAARAALDAEARDLGKKGPDALYGRGLVCGSCRNKY